ncbi:MAG: cytochrome P450 [Mycobacteriaceae bacterium]|nr:cytochrome P450 [Mycobacteriaceae bacterium]
MTDLGGCPRVPLSDPRFHADPAALYQDLRRDHGAVVAVELPGGVPAWLVIGYRELHQVTSDPDLFPRDARLWNQREVGRPEWPMPSMAGPPTPSITGTAGGEHRRHVGMVEPSLEAVDPHELRRTCEELADQLIDAFCGRGDADLVSEFARPLPVLALARVLGFPNADGPQLHGTLATIAHGGTDAKVAYQAFAAHTKRLLAAKRSRPGRDLASRMLSHPAALSDEEVVLDLMAVILAGHLTTADWIANSVRLMVADDRFAAAFGGRRSIGQAMNEALWEDTPVQVVAGRWAARDAVLGGRGIRAGDLLLLGLAGANADPHVRRHLADGGAPAAGNSAHFAFGYGEYRCPFPAQEIAEVIAQTGIEVLLDRLPDLDLAVPAADPARRPSAFQRGMTALPVRFMPVRALGATAEAAQPHP